MITEKQEVKLMIDKLPDSCTFEDIQYHLYVIEKIQRGIERAENEGIMTHEEVEKIFCKWTTR
jgi:hypothetical protein